MDIYTIGFTQTTAQRFFERLADAKIKRVLDVRLNNSSQLAGFAKAGDLEYFLSAILRASYEHDPRLAPTPELLTAGRKARTAAEWHDFERRFRELMNEREIHTHLDRASFRTRTALLCSEATAEHCHRRLIGEHLGQHWPEVSIVEL